MICSFLLVAIVACHLGDASVLKFEPEDGVKGERVELAQTAKGAHWALIVAGSNYWGNYRHQVTKNYFSPRRPLTVKLNSYAQNSIRQILNFEALKQSTGR